MLDTRILRQDPEAVALRLKVRGFELDTARFRALEAERAALQRETESLQQARNQKSKAIGQAKARGEDIAPLVAEVGGLGERLQDLRTRLGETQERLRAFLQTLPNIPDPSVPEGDDESDNRQIRTWGEPPSFNFEPLDHVDLGAAGGARLRGGGEDFGIALRGDEGPGRAPASGRWTQFMLDTHVSEHGYTEVYVPYIVNAAALLGTGQLPKFAEDQFRIAEIAESYLVPTAEVPVTNIYRESILDADALPIRHVCHTPCFRREAGTYGKDTRGMIRQHQFEKVELVQLTVPGRSWLALGRADRARRSHLAEAGTSLSRRGAVRRRPRLCGSQDHRPGSMAAGPEAVPGDFLVQQLPGLSGTPA